MSLLALLAACDPPADPDADPQDTASWTTPPGDPEAGYTALLNEDYVQCGVPASVYEAYFGPTPRSYRIPDREEQNRRLPYYMTATTSASGVDLITTNCLYCHATPFSGGIVVGLGNSSLDFTEDTAPFAALVPGLVSDPDEKAEAQKWADRVGATGPYIVTDTVGVNPADTLAQALFAHRDPQTLAWSEDALLPEPTPPIPTDVPPLWNLRKKTRTLYTGSGEGNLARIMMTASALCTDDTDDAAEIYSYFPDIHAYLAQTTPPAFPGAVDPALATAGQAVFEATCSQCHGTYGDDWTYDNLVIPLSEVATDPTLSASFDSPENVWREWFNGSWYGQDARLATTGGYVAPPLDGVWATAPYLHNGSVPTLRALLDSSTRPISFVRTSTYDTSTDIGWEWTDAPDGKASTDHDAIDVYDTRLPGYSNAGHTYGDALTTEDRDALIAYLTTL
jgi:cytochrome c5